MTDRLLEEICDYVIDHRPGSPAAWETARWCLLDSMGCALVALNYPACTQVLGPPVPGAELANGVPVPGRSDRLDPIAAAFDLGSMIRWLDYNDTWLAKEWGHPSDNLGAILACADYASRSAAGAGVLSMHHVLEAMIKAYEIQGVLALGNGLNRVGLDHVVFVRVASTAVATKLLGGTREQVLSALSHAWLDAGPLRTYRHAPNTGPRKSWAAGDATSRGVRLALLARRGQMGCPTVLTAPRWGFCDVMLDGQPLRLGRKLDSYVIRNILFKVSFPAEFHGQTAVEAALRLHEPVRNRLDQIQRITIETQESAVRIIDKTGPLHNPADRDHCIQYMVAVALLEGKLTADHYEDAAAADPRIDRLRQKMQVAENARYSTDYLDPQKRSIANAVQVFFTDGSQSERVEVEYPLGHRRRRTEALPLLKRKCRANMATRLDDGRCDQIMKLFDDADLLQAMPVTDFMDLVSCPRP